MRGHAYVAAFTFLAACGGLPALAQGLPIEDGAYLTDKFSCQELYANELDFLDFEVEANGNAFNFPETSCVVATIERIRSTRYRVEADCQEFGDVFQTSFFLDVISPDVIALDGEQHSICRGPADASAATEAAGEVASSDEIATLLSQWATENDGCRGGHGDDPLTQEACDRRSVISERLDELEMCYGRESDEATADYEWHSCERGSIRY